MMLDVPGATRARPGKALYSAGLAAAGISGVGDTSIAFAANAMRLKTYTISAPTSGPIQGQRKSDSITVEFTRNFTSPADTCDSILLLGAEFRYKTP